MKRGSGILLHLTSLPGRYGIGDLGHPAHEFIDFLAATGQQYWQFLPTGPTSPAFDNSPYMSLSAFAGNPLLIDPQGIAAAGYLAGPDLEAAPHFSDYLVDFASVATYKTGLLKIAFRNFSARETSHPDKKFTAFCQESDWLDAYALFMSLREENNFKAWCEWPPALARHEKKDLDNARQRLAEEIFYYKFEQFCFHEQWNKLRDHARSRKITLLGDIPFYIGLDSADVWANQKLFKLDPKSLAPTHVAGVPPDYFSATGQYWGNPIYCWQNAAGTENAELTAWWRQRFRHIFSTMDIVRIDHFRGFDSYWEIPATEKTAINGSWVKGPGLKFFHDIEKDLGKLPIIAEDLGIITPAVKKLRDDLGFPGMKILHFAFDDTETNPYLPHNYRTTNCVVYTGTHDNDTTVGWYLSDQTSPAARKKLQRYANSRDESGIHRDLIRLAFSSVADLAIIPLQDILGFGGDCRMNRPSTCQGNWRWRCAPGLLTEEVQKWLRAETVFYNRIPSPNNS